MTPNPREFFIYLENLFMPMRGVGIKKFSRRNTMNAPREVTAHAMGSEHFPGGDTGFLCSRCGFGISFAELAEALVIRGSFVHQECDPWLSL